MKAIIYHKSGSPDNLEYVDVPTPVPGPNEVLIKVRAAAANPLDWRTLKMAVGKLLTQGRPGRDVAGTVEAVGVKVTHFQPGDEVFGACRGAFAEYACAGQERMVRKPANVSFEQAASSPVAALTALQGLRIGGIQPGQKVLVNGAAGGVGTFTVQIARALGARVHGVCSGRNVEMVRGIGAEHVFDYTREDFTQAAERYDILFDNMGNHPWSALRKLLTPEGKYVGAGGPKEAGKILRAMPETLWLAMTNPQFHVVVAKMSAPDLTTIGELMASGKVTPVIDRRYSLREVPDALRYLEEGHARGKVIITVDE